MSLPNNLNQCYLILQTSYLNTVDEFRCSAHNLVSLLIWTASIGLDGLENWLLESIHLHLQELSKDKLSQCCRAVRRSEESSSPFGHNLLVPGFVFETMEEERGRSLDHHFRRSMMRQQKKLVLKVWLPDGSNFFWVTDISIKGAYDLWVVWLHWIELAKDTKIVDLFYSSVWKLKKRSASRNYSLLVKRYNDEANKCTGTQKA